MIKPAAENLFLRADLRKSLMAPLFYNILFNLSKFIQAEQRDPIKIKQVHSTPQLTDWDRYAIAGYYRLAECEQDQNAEQQHQDFNGTNAHTHCLTPAAAVTVLADVSFCYALCFAITHMT